MGLISPRASNEFDFFLIHLREHPCVIATPSANQIGSCVFSPKSVSCSQSTPSPWNDNIQSGSSLQMSLAPGDHQSVSDYRCTCRKCGSNGKILPRATWYKHNPGGKKGKAPQLTQEDIASILSRPTPAWGNRRKRTYEEVLAGERLRLSKRATAGSSSVRMRPDQNICASIA